MSKQDFDLAFGYELTPAAFFNFKNNLTFVARIISRTPTGISFKQTGKMTSKKIRLFLTPTSKISCPLFEYLNTKSNLNLLHLDLKGFTKLFRLRGIDISLKDFLTKLHFNKIKSPAQRDKYDDVINNGLCRSCPT